MDMFLDQVCHFDLFKFDIDTKHQFQFCGIWLEFSRFSIDACKFIVTLPEMYTVTCEYKEKYTGRCQCSKSAALSTEFCICNGEECCT